MGWVKNATAEVNAVSQWKVITIVCIVLSILSITTVSMRLWVRAKSRGLAADDHLAIVAVVFALLYSITCIVQTKWGLGLPIALRPPPNLVPYTRWNFAGRPIYQLGISFFKVALLISYLHLFQGTNQRNYRLTIYIAIGLISAAHFGCTLSLIFACTPVHKSWNPAIPGTCLAPEPSFTGYAAVTIASDVIVALIPIPMLVRLNVSQARKVGLLVVFLLGLFTTACSIARYVQIDRIQSGDGNSTMLILWGTIEFNVGNMVSSLPFLAPVFLRKAKEYRNKHSSSDKNTRRAHKFSRRLRSKPEDAYNLSSLSRSGGEAKSGSRGNMFTASASHNLSEENMLQDSPDNSIMSGRGDTSILKSVTYTVHVQHENNENECELGRRFGASMEA